MSGGEGGRRVVEPEPEVDDRVSGNHLWLLHSCERRLWLDRHAREEAAPAGEFDELLRLRGREHEALVRSRMAPCEGPIHWRGRPIEDSVAETLRLLRESRATLYQPALVAADDRALGVPDFIYWDGDAPVVHDAKLATNLADHGEIPLQLTHYRVLLGDMGLPGARLEITDGRGEVVEIDPVPETAYCERRTRANELLRGGREPDLLLAHSTCGACPFYDHCWDRAEREQRIEILPGVTQSIGARFRGLGIGTVRDLAGLDPDAIRGPGVKAKAESILAEARAFRDAAPAWIGSPDLPAGRPIVWLDFEGVMDLIDNALPIYLWGLAVDRGSEDLETEAILADTWPEGNEQAWRRFLDRASEILTRWPDSRWVHYHHYEKDWIRRYAAAFGDPGGVVPRLQRALWDLNLEGLGRWVRLPLRSYSIKFVARYVGFDWSNPESGSLWSVVQYQKARATPDPAARQALLDAIVRYNGDDLMAMRAVWRWIERERP